MHYQEGISEISNGKQIPAHLICLGIGAHSALILIAFHVSYILSSIYHHIAIALISGDRTLHGVTPQALYFPKTLPDPIKSDLHYKILHSFNPTLLILVICPAGRLDDYNSSL